MLAAPRSFVAAAPETGEPKNTDRFEKINDDGGGKFNAITQKHTVSLHTEHRHGLWGCGNGR
jgi:hypothetical protein